MPTPPADALTEYHRKRSLDRTPEPGGGGASPGGNLFVVQKHAATRMHYDLRLELDGVLLSWAVPKRPSYDQADKRVAIRVEDHPVEYAEFEGLIPEGNYGAGPVIIWDRGVWVPVEDPHAGLESGKLLFELRGYKLRGRWTLVKIRKAEQEWLLIKERDGLEGPGRELPEASILSGLTVEQLGAGHDPGAAVLERVVAAGAPERAVRAASVKAMLAEPRAAPFSRRGWVFELKYDGYRAICGLARGRAQLVSRNGNDLTGRFPELAASLERLPFGDLVLDGEIVIHDDRGLPSFQRLQQRAQLRNAHDIRLAATRQPATLYLFDCLGFAGHDLRPLPLVERKEVLRMLLPPAGPLRYSEHIPEQGEELYARVVAMELEGIVAKKADGPYRAGRSADWLKIRADLVDDFVVVGWTLPKGGRSGFGALHLAAWDGDRLVYTGRVGSGFSDAQLEEAEAALTDGRVRKPRAEGAPTGREHRWVEPRLVVEVRYKEYTGEGLLRHPVFLRFRPDKGVHECLKRVPATELASAPEAAETAQAQAAQPQAAQPQSAHPVDAQPQAAQPGPARSAQPGPAPSAGTHAPTREVRVTNANKVFWPDAGYTKGDLVAYYETVAEWILPYLRDRPLVLTRFPDGIEGKSFYQKDAPEWAPDWLRTETLWSEGAERALDCFICDHVDALRWVANSAAIPLHIWHSRIGSLDRPDWCVIDLDPKDAPFADVIRVARALHALCRDIGLEPFVKTSGSSGIHVLLPLARRFTHEQSRILGHLISRVLVAEHPGVATLERVIRRRAGKVYLDYLQNGHGKLIVAPFSVRARPGASVSAPLHWDEVKPGLAIDDFTIATMPARMRELGADPVVAVLETEPDLLGALERLQARLGTATGGSKTGKK